MARELRVKVTGESSGAIVALQETQSAIKKLGSESVTSVGQSKAEFSSLLAEIEKTSPELAGLSKAAFDAGLALDKAGDSKSIGQLTQRLIEAQIKVDQFAAGLEKAAVSGADVGDKPTKSLQNMQAAIDTLKAHLGNLEGATEEAKAKLGLVGEPGAKSLSALGKASADAVAALQRLDKAGDARQLTAGMKDAQFKAETLREELDRVAKAGGKVDDEAIAALNSLESGMDRAALKSAKLADNTDDLRKKSKLGAEGFQAAAGYAGSLEGMLGALADTSGKAGEAVGKAAIGVTAMAGAFATGYAAGEKIRDLFRELTGKEMPSLSEKIATLLVNWRALGEVMDGTEKKTITASGQFDKQASFLDKIAWALKSQFGAMTGLGSAQDVLTEKTKKYVEQGKIDLEQKEKTRYAYDKASEAMGKLFGGFEDAGAKVAALTKQGEGMDRWIQASIKSGEDWKKALSENKEKLQKWVEELDKAPGVIDKLPPKVKEAVDYIRSLGTVSAQTTDVFQGLVNALASINTNSAAGTIAAIADAIGKAKAAGADWLPVMRQNQNVLEELYKRAEKEGFEALSALRKQIMDQLPAWQAAELVNKAYAESVEKINRAYKDESAKKFQQNTEDLARSIEAARAATAGWNAEMNAQMDAWTAAARNMGPVEIAIRHATKPVEEQTQAFKDMIEALATASDKFPHFGVQIGNWVARLEAGQLTMQQFRDEIARFRVEFIAESGMMNGAFGDYDMALNELNAALNQFTDAHRSGAAAIDDFWERLAKAQGEMWNFHKATKATNEELEKTIVVAGRVDKVTGGAMGTSRAKELADALLDELEKRSGIK